MSKNLDLFPQFKTNAENVGATVARAAGFAEAQEILKEYLTQNGVKSMVTIPSKMVDELKLKDLTGELGITLHPEVTRANSFGSDAGICEVELGVAETGSVLQIAPDIASRYVSTLPPISVLLVRADKMVETIPQAVQYLYDKHQGEIPGYAGFITGPSRTADIERVLTIGVHGPAKVLLLVIDEK